jgi:hypothetical protein
MATPALKQVSERCKLQGRPRVVARQVEDSGTVRLQCRGDWYDVPSNPDSLPGEGLFVFLQSSAGKFNFEVEAGPLHQPPLKGGGHGIKVDDCDHASGEVGTTDGKTWDLQVRTFASGLSGFQVELPPLGDAGRNTP